METAILLNNQSKTEEQKSKDMLTAVLRSVKSVTKIEEAINGFQLVKLSRDLGVKQTAVLIANLIVEQSSAWNMPNTITVEQAYNIAEMIFMEHKHLTIEDIAMMFREAIMRKDGYEKPYGRLDSSLIFSWLNNYIDRRIECSEMVYQQTKNQQRNDELETGANLMEHLAPLLEKIVNKEKEAVKPESKSFLTKEKHEKFIRDNMAEFTNHEIKEFILRFKAQNLFGNYTQMIEELEKELKTR